MERAKGFEPSTSTLARLRSTPELRPHWFLCTNMIYNESIIKNILIVYDQLELIELLKKKNYGITVHHHDALFTVQDSKILRGEIDGVHSKNLFLKNKKNNFFLLTFEETDKVDLKKISKSLELGNTSFAKEKYLDQFLKIKPGSVSPFALLNDEGGHVDFYLEQTLYESKFVNFHPLINTLTITIETKRFVEFMIENDKKIHIFSSAEGKVLKKYGK